MMNFSLNYDPSQLDHNHVFLGSDISYLRIYTTAFVTFSERDKTSENL